MASIDTLSINISATTNKAKKNIDDLNVSLNKLGSTLSKNINSTKLDSVSDSFVKLSQATAQFGRSASAINNIPKITTALKDMIVTLAGTPDLSGNIYKLADACEKLANVGSFKEVSNGLKDVMKSANVKPQRAKSGTITSDATEDTAKNQEKVLSLTQMIASAFKNLGGFAVNFAKGVGKVASFLGKAKANMEKFHSAQKKSFSHGLKWILKYVIGVRSLYALFNKLKSAIEEGNKNLAKFDSTFNASMSKIKSGFKNMGNGLSVAFAPIVNAVSEMASRVMKIITEMFNKIARLFATFTGAKKVVQVNTNYMYDYADSLDKASKKAQQLSIDELNILDSGNSSGGTDVDVNDMFKTIEVGTEFESLIARIQKAWANADFTGMGKELGEKIIRQLNRIPWKEIQSNASKVGTSLATLLNGVISSEVDGKSFGYTVGSTIGNGIQTALSFAKGFADDFGFEEFGVSISEGIEGCLDTISWEDAGETFSNFVEGFIDTLTGFFNNKEMWQKVGQAIVDAFCGIDWFSLTWKTFNLIQALKNALLSAIEGAFIGVLEQLGLSEYAIGIKELFKVWQPTTIGAITGYATGGMPEDGFFYANHNELVGGFSNGRTAVANNDMIVEGIQGGVERAVSQTLVPYLSDIANSSRTTANKDMTLDGRVLFKSNQAYASDYTKRTGRSAFA